MPIEPSKVMCQRINFTVSGRKEYLKLETLQNYNEALPVRSVSLISKSSVYLKVIRYMYNGPKTEIGFYGPIKGAIVYLDRNYYLLSAASPRATLVYAADFSC
jgi:hypothetical protein